MNTTCIRATVVEVKPTFEGLRECARQRPSLADERLMRIVQRAGAAKEGRSAGRDPNAVVRLFTTSKSVMHSQTADPFAGTLAADRPFRSYGHRRTSGCLYNADCVADSGDQVNGSAIIISLVFALPLH
jgi:hypothetical protein